MVAFYIFSKIIIPTSQASSSAAVVSMQQVAWKQGLVRPIQAPLNVVIVKALQTSLACNVIATLLEARLFESCIQEVSYCTCKSR